MSIVGAPYMLLVDNTFMVSVGNIQAANAALSDLQATPFNGVTIPGWDGNYSKIPLLETDKHVWPWVLLKFILQKDLNIMDFDDVYNCRTTVLTTWRAWLNATKEAGQPGLVFDIEMYDDAPHTYTWVSGGAEKLGMSIEEYITKIEGLGAEMCDIANEVYPTATIWFLVTLIWAFSEEPGVDSFTSARFVNGFLNRAKVTNSQLTIIEGSEVHIPYLPGTLATTERWCDRVMDFYPLTRDKWPQLKLGAPCVLWGDRASTTGWVKNTLDALSADGLLKIQGGFDLYPVLKRLAAHTDYLWIYLPGETDYDPFNVTTRQPFDRMLRHIKHRPRITAQCNDPNVYDTKAALADFDSGLKRGCYVRPEELI